MSPGARFRAGVSLACALVACAPAAKPVPATVPPTVVSSPPPEPAVVARVPIASAVPLASWQLDEPTRPYGFASVSGYDPSTGAARGDLSLRSHRVKTLIVGGLARTEVVEEWANDQARAVEARLALALPDGASVSRFALGRGNALLEARVFDSDQIALIPRGPSSERWEDVWPGRDERDTLRMRLVGFAPKEKRTLLLSYDEELAQRASSELYRYALPKAGNEGAPAREFSIEVTLLGEPSSFGKIATPNYPATIRSLADRVLVTLERHAAIPGQDFTVEIERVKRAQFEVRSDVSAAKTWPAQGYVSLRFELPTDADSKPSDKARSTTRVILLDKSYPQSAATFQLQRLLSEGLVRTAADERVVLLACDSSCAAWPTQGMSAAGAEAARGASTWLAGLARSGSFDLEGALAHAVALFEPESRGQVVYFGASRVSAGVLESSALFESVAYLLAKKGADLRVYGVGPARDEAALFGLVLATDATYGVLSDAVPSELQLAELWRALRAPKLTQPQLALPAGVHDPEPARLPALVTGQSLRITARLEAPVQGTVRLSGKLRGHDYIASYPVAIEQDDARSNPLVARHWARERLSEARVGSSFVPGESQLARSAGIASRHTDWLLLEAERDYRAYGLTGARVEPGPPPRAASSAHRPRGAFPERTPRGLLSSPIWKPERRAAFPPLRPRGRVELVSGAEPNGLDASEYAARRRRDIQSLRSLCRACYERTVARTQGWLEGRIDFSLRVDARGLLESLAAEAPSARDVGSLFGCLRAEAARVSFEAPPAEARELQFSLDFAIDWSRGLTVHYPPAPGWPFGGGRFEAVITAADEMWRSASLRTESGRLASALLQAHSAEQAIEVARRSVEAEPRSLAALNVLGTAAGGYDEFGLLSAVLEAKLALSPDQPELRRRLARAWLAAGDERRACAHLRSLPAARLGTNLSSANALCRTRWLEELALPPVKPVSPEAARKIIADALDEVERNKPCHPFTVVVRCADSHPCPSAVVLTPEWQLISAFGDISGKGSVEPLSFWPAMHGTYRVLLFGGDPQAHGSVDLSVHLDSSHFEFHRGGVVQTVASVELRSEPPSLGAVGIPMCGGAP